MFEGYDSNKCVLKREGYTSKLSLSIKPLVIVYFQESFMRFKEYFFEQFLNSLIFSDPYIDPLRAEFENLKNRKTIKRDTLKNMTDFKQITEIMDMNIKIENCSLNIPERPHSKTFLTFHIDELTVGQ